MISQELASSKINKFLILRIILLSIGLAITALGITLMYKSTLGTNPMATVCDGLSRILGISYGSANTIINVLFLVVVLILSRKNIGIGTVITVFTLGLYMNFWKWVLPELNNDISLISKIIISLIGTVVSSMGLSFYIQFELGMGPLECLVEFIHEKTKLEYKVAKTLFDALLLILGILMGGAFGIGTALNVLLTGKLMGNFIEFHQKYLGGIYKLIL